mmetsp:Transcript_5153/g.5905  ORF Transcript_5153/g.5905 Transcript_5153/m.5905 type:complete len:177 (-) Transcript_5153:67-597(-)
MHNEENPVIVANDRIYPFALKYHPEAPYLSNHDKYTICLDSVLDWQMQYGELRNSHRTNSSTTSQTLRNFTTEKCSNSFNPYPMPEFFVLRYYHPGNMMYKKMEKFLADPFITEKDKEGKSKKIKLIAYKKAYSFFRKAWATRCRPHVVGGTCIEYNTVYRREDEDCEEVQRSSGQ